jgi:hypothetical protein
VTDDRVEQTIADTVFGSVTNKRVIYFRNKGWFRGGSREDIPLKHITSVRLDVTRRIVMGGLLLLYGLFLIKLAGFWGFVLGFIPGGLGVLLLWGSPSVVVNTAGQDLKAARGFPWKREEATLFVEALRKQLFGE